MLGPILRTVGLKRTEEFKPVSGDGAVGFPGRRLLRLGRFRRLRRLGLLLVLWLAFVEFVVFLLLVFVLLLFLLLWFADGSLRESS